MISKVMLLGLTMAVLTMTTVASADEVFMTQNGAKYHKKICRIIKNKEVHSIDKDEAMKNGFEPCKKCFKEDLALIEQDHKEVKLKKK